MRNTVACFVIAAIFLLPCTGNTSTSQGIEWLSQQQQFDGGFHGRLSLQEQATVQVLNLARDIPIPALDSDAAKRFVQNHLATQAISQTEFTALALQLDLTADNDGNSRLENLLLAQNSDGGFGDQPGYQSTAYDTAFALTALHRHNGGSPQASRAVFFLLNSQRADGSWHHGGSPDIRVTAMAARALWYYRHGFADVAASLQSAMQYLVSVQQDHLWETDAQSALVLIALLPVVSSPQTLSASVEALSDRQQPDGSWGGDVYSTALVLRALLLAANPAVNPDLARLGGRLVDGDTGLPLASVVVALGGDAVSNVASNSQGVFAFEGLDPGRYTLGIHQPGYLAVAWEGDLQVGVSQNLGDILLTRSAGGAGLASAYVQGQVTDAATGLPLDNAVISIGGSSRSASTDANGRYLITGVTPGYLMLTATRAGYVGATGAGEVNAGQALLFSPTLYPAVVSGSRISGVVTDASTAVPLPGVAIAMSGANSGSALTDESGFYQFDDLQPGAVTLQFSKDSHHSLSVALDVISGIQYQGSIALSLLSEVPMEQPAAITGMVVDGKNGPGLAGVTVALSAGGQTHVEQTDSEGAFTFSALEPGQATVSIHSPGYFEQTVNVTLASHITADLGRIELLSTAVEYGFGGVVLDSATNLPLQDVLLTVTSDSGASTITTNANGQFALSQLSSSQVTLLFEKQDYVASTTLAMLEPNRITDIGQVRLRYSGYTDLLTDMAVTALDLHGLRNNPVSLDVSGTVRATIKNLGATPVHNAFSVAAFYDTNGDGVFSGVDVELGRTRVDQALTGELDVDIVVQGKLPFRDAPISVVVDAGSDIVESNKDNNVMGYACRKTCVLLKDGFDSSDDIEWGHQPGPRGFEIVEGIYESGGVASAAYTGDPGWKNYSVETAIRFPEGATDYAGLLFRHQNMDNWYQIRVRHNEIQLVARLGGGPLQVLRSAPVSVAADQWYRIRVDVQGTVARAYLNDQQIFEYGTLTLSEGSVGYAYESVRVQYDNLQVDTCSADFSMELKWHWQGAPGTNADVFGPIMVAQLTDDNGDGIINEKDIPDLIFHSTSNRLVAVSGDTGETLWVNSPAMVNGWGSPAVADLDGDGLVEIVSVSNSRTQIHAFDHSGALVWSTPSTPALTNPRDAITIADLNQDGSPEIIHGRRAYSANGQLLWQGAGHHGGQTNYGLVPIAADIDLSGTMEVIAGATAYNADGSIKWQQSAAGDGFTAIGNFDDDDYPEIVLVSSGRLYLLEHTGAIQWGPVLIGGGVGGPPTVADVDGDGEPDIGVAGLQYFSVFGGDGSLKWRRPISDFSSSRTGSSVFDFQADGRAELIYGDERFLRVYDGQTGDILAEVANDSGTTLEYPVIADIDNSGSASIIVGSNAGPVGERGVKAYGSANNDWVGTRGIWNQHAYHINNINDDGTVPRVVTPSWLDHNTYRLNRFPGAGPQQVYDLTLSLLTLIDNGTGNASSVSTRIGNGGSLQSPATSVSLYKGSLSGLLLGTVQINPLAPDSHVDVRIDGLQNLSRNDTIVAVVNQEGRFAECNSYNNIQAIQVDAVLGNISLATDNNSYPQGSNVYFSATIANTGIFAADYQLVWRIADASGNTVADLGQVQLPAMQSGASDIISHSWNTSQVVAGGYRIAARLLSLDGTELAMDGADFVVSATNAAGNPATVQVTLASDKPLYQAWDRAVLSGHVMNNAVNVSLPDGVATLTVTSPSGLPVFTETFTVHGLAAQALQAVEGLLALADAESGLYQVRLDLRSSSDATLLGTATTTFSVERNPLQLFTGTTAANLSSVDRGGMVSCADTITNRSAAETLQIAIHHRLLDTRNQQEIRASDESLTLSPGQTHTYIHGIDTSGLSEGPYTCLQEVSVGADSIALSHDSFTVSAPPIVIAGKTGTKGRLLVLLDGPAEGCPAVKGSDLFRHFGSKFHLWDIWSIKPCLAGDSGKPDMPTRFPPFGSLLNTGLAEPQSSQPSQNRQQQLDYLAALLLSDDYRFTIVFDAEDFEREMFSGNYHGYLVKSEKINLSPDAEMILAEAVNRGAGLLVSGALNRKNSELERALGISATGQELKASGVLIPESALGSDWPETIINPRKKQDFDLCGARTLATYIKPVKNWLALRGCLHHFGINNPAAAQYEYGEGKGIYLGFDALEEAAAGNADSAYEALLRYSFANIQPMDFPVRAGAVVPLTFTISDAAAATDLALRVNLPDNLDLVDATTDLIREDAHTNTWHGSEVLYANETLDITLYLKLLDDSASTLTVEVEPSRAGSALPAISLNHSLHPEPSGDALSEAIALLQASVTQDYDIHIKLALGYARAAAGERAAGDLDAAINAILKALDRLADRSSAPAQQARLLLDHELFRLLAQ